MSDNDLIKNVLLIINAQEDFHDKEKTFKRLASNPSSGLPIIGSCENTNNIIKMLLNDIKTFEETKKTYFKEIDFILDSHSINHISHSAAWSRLDGESVEAGVVFKLNDDETEIVNATPVKNMKPGTIIYKAAEPCLQKWYLEYVKKMVNEQKIHPLIWNTQCVRNSHGWQIEENLWETALNWSNKTGSTIFLHEKGENPLCEMYSAMKALIPYEEMIETFPIETQNEILDYICLSRTKPPFQNIHNYEKGTNRNMTTKFNEPLFQHLCGATPEQQNRLYICGQTKSHCVNWSTRDIVDEIEHLEMRTDLVVILENMMSNLMLPDSVPNSSTLNKKIKTDGETFINDMKKKGVQVINSNI